MCWRYLGAEFDIHGGGLDLVFPHHENEIAQSRAAGLPFARYWVHHALLNLGEAKMSKSLGNVIDLAARRGARRPAGRAALLPRARRTTARGSTTPTRRCGRPPSPTGGSRASSSGRSSGSAPVEPGDAAGRRSSRRWTTTSTPRRRSPSCTTTVREGNTALADGDDDAAARGAGRGAGDARRARSRPARPGSGPAPARRRRCEAWSTRWSRSRWSSAPRPAPARTGRPPTRSATSSSRPASWWRTPRTVHDGRSEEQTDAG